MRYAAHEILVSPARPSAGLGRLVAGVAMTVVLFVILSVTWSGLLPVLFGASDRAGFARATTPAGVLVNLFTFALLLAALAMTLRMMHGRGLASLTGPTRLALRQGGRALGALVMLYVAIAVVPMPDTITPEANLDPGRWALLLPLALAGLFVQVFAEEAVFRGYLQSQLAARFAAPLIWMGLPAVVFGVMHLDPGLPGATGWLVVAWATGFGLAAGDLTARFGTLGPATALHFMNNFSVILIAAPKGSFDGLALYRYPFGIEDAAAMTVMLPLDILLLLCSWLAIRVALRG